MEITRRNFLPLPAAALISYANLAGATANEVRQITYMGWEDFWIEANKKDVLLIDVRKDNVDPVPLGLNTISFKSKVTEAEKAEALQQIKKHRGGLAIVGYDDEESDGFVDYLREHGINHSTYLLDGGVSNYQKRQEDTGEIMHAKFEIQ